MDSNAINAMADHRVAMEQQSRKVTVQAQVDTLRMAVAYGLDVDTLLVAVGTLLMDNLCKR